MKYRILIIEDEAPARDIIRNFLTGRSDVELIAECDNGFEGVKAVNELKPDVVFLDIQMPKLTGFEALELFDHKPQVIFTTAFDEYAIKAFEINAADYVMKPFSKERLYAALDKAMGRINQTTSVQSLQLSESYQKAKQEWIERIAVKTGNKITVIAVNDVIFIQASDDYVEIHTETGHFLKEKTLKSLEGSLDPKLFKRVHRSFIVNLTAVQKIEHYTKDSYIAIMSNGEKIKVSSSGYRELKETLGI